MKRGHAMHPTGTRMTLALAILALLAGNLASCSRSTRNHRHGTAAGLDEEAAQSQCCGASTAAPTTKPVEGCGALDLGAAFAGTLTRREVANTLRDLLFVTKQLPTPAGGDAPVYSEPQLVKELSTRSATYAIPE